MNLTNLKQFPECNEVTKLVTIFLSWIAEVTVLQHSTVVFQYSSCEKLRNDSVSNLYFRLQIYSSVSCPCRLCRTFFMYREWPQVLENCPVSTRIYFILAILCVNKFHNIILVSYSYIELLHKIYLHFKECACKMCMCACVCVCVCVRVCVCVCMHVRTCIHMIIDYVVVFYLFA